MKHLAKESSQTMSHEAPPCSLLFTIVFIWHVLATLSSSSPISAVLVTLACVVNIWYRRGTTVAMIKECAHNLAIFSISKCNVFHRLCRNITLKGTCHCCRWSVVAVSVGKWLQHCHMKPSKYCRS